MYSIKSRNVESRNKTLMPLEGGLESNGSIFWS